MHLLVKSTQYVLLSDSKDLEGSFCRNNWLNVVRTFERRPRLELYRWIRKRHSVTRFVVPFDSYLGSGLELEAAVRQVLRLCLDPARTCFLVPQKTNAVQYRPKDPYRQFLGRVCHSFVLLLTNTYPLNTTG